MIEILKVITERYGGNISKINIETDAGIFVGRFPYLCSRYGRYRNLMQNIIKIKEVNSVQRVQE